jgi:hypothetical protein
MRLKVTAPHRVMNPAAMFASRWHHSAPWSGIRAHSSAPYSPIKTAEWQDEGWE